MGHEVSWRSLQPAGLQMGSSAMGDVVFVVFATGICRDLDVKEIVLSWTRLLREMSHVLLQGHRKVSLFCRHVGVVTHTPFGAGYITLPGIIGPVCWGLRSPPKPAGVSIPSAIWAKNEPKECKLIQHYILIAPAQEDSRATCGDTAG